jgi:dihydroxyacetone kinase-like predicted kinase
MGACGQSGMIFSQIYVASDTLQSLKTGKTRTLGVRRLAAAFDDVAQAAKIAARRHSCDECG